MMGVERNGRIEVAKGKGGGDTIKQRKGIKHAMQVKRKN